MNTYPPRPTGRRGQWVGVNGAQPMRSNLRQCRLSKTPCRTASRVPASTTRACLPALVATDARKTPRTAAMTFGGDRRT